jgi:hypothetical protein
LKLRIPHGRLDQPLDARSIWQLPKTLDGEESLIAREIFIECHRSGSRRVGDVIDLSRSSAPSKGKHWLARSAGSSGLHPSRPRHVAEAAGPRGSYAQSAAASRSTR